MAYDKVVDSDVLDAGLKQIADAIREKAEISDNLAFPRVMVEAIAGIKNGLKKEFGSFTTETNTTVSNTSQFVINHGIGKVPYMINITVYGSASATNGLDGLTVINSDIPLDENETMWMNMLTKKGSSGHQFVRGGSKTSNRDKWTEDTVSFPLAGSGSISFVLEAGKTYDWVIIG